MALFYNFVLRDMLLWLAALAGAENLAPPALQLDVLTTILYAALAACGHLKKSKAARNNPPLAKFLGLSGGANSLLRVG